MSVVPKFDRQAYFESELQIRLNRFEARALLAAWTLITEERIRRLVRLEDGFVRLLDRIEATVEEIRRGQVLQIEAMREIERLT